jgi:hypothetical protein
MPDTRRQLLGQKVGSRFHHSTYIHYLFGVRVTRFATLDSPDVVRKFYYTTLAEKSSYQKTSEDDNEYFETFEYETRSRRDSYLESAYGLGVMVKTTPGYKKTNVAVMEYQYEKLPRACHPYNYYNDPWNI